MDSVEQPPSIVVPAQDCGSSTAVEGKTTAAVTSGKISDRTDQPAEVPADSEDTENQTNNTDDIKHEDSGLNGNTEEEEEKESAVADPEVIVNGVEDHESEPECAEAIETNKEEVSETIEDIEEKKTEEKETDVATEDVEIVPTQSVVVNGESTAADTEGAVDDKDSDKEALENGPDSVNSNDKVSNSDDNDDNSNVDNKNTDKSETDNTNTDNTQTDNTETDNVQTDNVKTDVINTELSLKEVNNDSKLNPEGSSEVNCDKTSGLADTSNTEDSSDKSADDSANVLVESVTDTGAEESKVDKTEDSDETEPPPTNTDDNEKIKDDVSRSEEQSETVEENEGKSESVEEQIETVENVPSTEDTSDKVEETSNVESVTHEEVSEEKSEEIKSENNETEAIANIVENPSDIEENSDKKQDIEEMDTSEELSTKDEKAIEAEVQVDKEQACNNSVKVEEEKKDTVEEVMEVSNVQSDECESKISEISSNVVEKVGDSCKLAAPTVSPPKSKKTLDQVLSKISVLASESKTTDTETVKEKTVVPKKAKARKSCVHSQGSNKVSSIPQTITSLTFNVKELEKKGVLDVPKQSKRKAFEPVKVKTNNFTASDANSISPKTSPVRSPNRSPVRSPGKIDSPFFKKRPKIKFKGKRRKLKLSGNYKLPCEKKRDKRKKESEERQLELDSESDNPWDKKNSSAFSIKSKTSNLFDKSVPLKYVSKAHQNALDIMTKNASLSFNAHPNSLTKKAKKSVKQSIDPSCTRTLDSYFKGTQTSPGAVKKAPSSVGSQDSIESGNSEARKRKAGDESASNDRAGPRESGMDPSLLSPEEKRRKVEDMKVPQQLITLIPTTVSGSQPLQPILPASISGSPNQFIIAPSPSSKSPQQTLIQNGTQNGMPIFKLLSSQPGMEGQPPQLVTLAQSPGKSLLMHHVPKTGTFLQPKGVPLIFMQPVSGSNTTVSSASILVASASPQTQAGPRSVLHSLMTQPKMQLPNGQILDMKPGTHYKMTHGLPNGLYPVTPPKTPEGSDAGLTESAEVSPGGSVPPEKDVIPLCTCKISGASFQKMTTNLSFCQALDSVDGKVMGCCNKVTNSQLVRPAVKIPFLAVCETHRKRLRVHQCCPGCGHYCTQGKFYQCKKDGSNSLHYFHEQCQVVRGGKNYCPHCGEHSNQYEVELTLEDTKPSMSKDSKAGRTQSKARIEMSKRGTPGPEDQPEDHMVTFTLDKSKKTLSTSDIPIGPDRYSLEKFLTCMNQERPKKYRHLPKCLFTPAYDNDLERTIYMLEDGHDPNEKYEDLEEQGALHAAAAVGSLPIVHVLIQAGASPHIQDNSLKTPLMYAAENNHPDVVSYLIKAGAIVDAKADDGMTALHNAAKAGHVNILKILLDTERIHIDIKDDGGWTPLIWAAEHHEVESVKFLLKRHADPNIRDSEENTTLHWAAFSGSVAIAELLLLAGCDLDSLNMHGDRPLHIAARQDHYECVVLFLARGADVDARNNKNETPAECVLDQTSAVYLSLRVNKQLKSFGAKHMSRPEKLLHRDLSKGRENIPIPCVNAADDEGIPQDYLYVTDNIETTCLHINRVIGSLQSCQCKDDCSSIYCACGKNSIKCWYDKFGRLVPEFNMLEPPLIFECNRACECWTTCNNRVVQNGVMSRLQVFKTNGRGWGCKTLVDIQRGTFICEYIGEHISDSEADRREDDSYLFDLDNRDGETYCIDARRYGNVARFINHLCEPNLVPVKVFVDSQDLRFPRICLFASRDIKANEELGFDYGEKFWIIKWKQFTCTCGSMKCRYSTETIQKTLEEYRLRHEDDGEVVQE